MSKDERKKERERERERESERKRGKYTKFHEHHQVNEDSVLSKPIGLREHYSEVIENWGMGVENFNGLDLKYFPEYLKLIVGCPGLYKSFSTLIFFAFLRDLKASQKSAVF